MNTKTIQIQKSMLKPVCLGVLLGASMIPAMAQPVCKAPLVPADVLSQLKTSFPGWRTKESMDLKPVAQRFWSELEPIACPGVALGAFEPGNARAFAFLLVPKQDPNSRYRLVVATRQPSDSKVVLKVISQSDHAARGDYFIRLVPLKNAESKSQQGLPPKPTGMRTDFFDEKTLASLQTKFGIMLCNDAEDEVGISLLYWFQDSYRSKDLLSRTQI